MTTRSVVEFLLERVTEDEEEARAAATAERWAYVGYGEFGPFVSGAGVETEDSSEGVSRAEFIASHHPGRVLAECAAMRRMLALLDEVNDEGIPRLTVYLREMMPRLLALPYSDHPDYRPEWRP